ncbi:hypothetical protein B0H10DRAFT_713230 [Mycena sp. CBHHK59/15]|nr:hypothetical protein B0H10DRAFT_713230 [Mycena sp. CBHHK59/15]
MGSPSYSTTRSAAGCLPVFRTNPRGSGPLSSSWLSSIRTSASPTTLICTGIHGAATACPLPTMPVVGALMASRLILSNSLASVEPWEVGTNALLAGFSRGILRHAQKHEIARTTDSEEYQQGFPQFNQNTFALLNHGRTNW